MGPSLGDDFRTTRRRAAATLWRIAPDGVLIAGESPLDGWSQAETGPDLVRLDLSEARIRLRLDGPDTAGMLARVVSVNTSLAAFAPGSFVQTGLHQVGVLIDRLSEDRFDVLVPQSWARSVGGVLQLHLTDRG